MQLFRKILFALRFYSQPFSVMLSKLSLPNHAFSDLGLQCLLKHACLNIMSKYNMNQSMTKPTKWHVHTVKTQIRLGIRPV